MRKTLKRLRAARRAYRESKHFQREAQLTPLGFWLAGNAAMQHGKFEPTETKIVSELLDEVEVLINVGANIGYYCCLALSRHKQVVAFEPMPQNVTYLIRNLKLNNWQDDAEIFPVALGAQTGTIEIWGQGTGASLIKGWAGQTDDSTWVPVSTLDTILNHRFSGRPCLILVDIEGAEWHMLQGATQILQADPKPIWMVEISIEEHQPAGVSINPRLSETFAIFRDAGYTAYTANLSPREIKADEIARIVATQIDTIGTHNFIFRCQ